MAFRAVVVRRVRNVYGRGSRDTRHGKARPLRPPSVSSLKERVRVKWGVEVLGLVWSSSYVPRRDGTPAGSRWSARSRRRGRTTLTLPAGRREIEWRRGLVGLLLGRVLQCRFSSTVQQELGAEPYGWPSIPSRLHGGMELMRTTVPGGLGQADDHAKKGSGSTPSARLDCRSESCDDLLAADQAGKAADAPVTQPVEHQRQEFAGGRDLADLAPTTGSDAFAVIAQQGGEQQPLHGLDRAPSAPAASPAS